MAMLEVNNLPVGVVTSPFLLPKARILASNSSVLKGFAR